MYVLIIENTSIPYPRTHCDPD